MNKENQDYWLGEFEKWWKENETHLADIGFKNGPFDPKNCLGAIPVAQLIRDKGDIAGLNDS